MLGDALAVVAAGLPGAALAAADDAAADGLAADDVTADGAAALPAAAVFVVVDGLFDEDATAMMTNAANAMSPVSILCRAGQDLRFCPTGGCCG